MNKYKWKFSYLRFCSWKPLFWQHIQANVLQINNIKVRCTKTDFATSTPILFKQNRFIQMKISISLACVVISERQRRTAPIKMQINIRWGRGRGGHWRTSQKHYNVVSYHRPLKRILKIRDKPLIEIVCHVLKWLVAT